MLAAWVLAAAVWPAPGARVHVDLHGKFDSQPADLANHINEPANAQHMQGLPLPVSPEALEALNAGLPDAVESVLTALGQKPDHGALAKLQKGAKPLTDGDDDSRFSLELAVAEPNGLGGRAGGLDLRARIRSLQRAPDLVGEAVASVAPAKDKDAALLALRGALMDAISRALVDLHEHLHDDAVRPRVHVHVQVALAGLSTTERKDAMQLLACAAGLVEPLSVTHVDAGSDDAVDDLEVRLKRVDPDETLEQFIKSYAGTLDVQLGPNGKDRCSTWHTALEGRRAVALPSQEGVRIRFESRDAGP
ncbi:MAG: hypothetical protein JST54_21110 [Deltaproteobacteria bacterium]|nr:hypothetical protein [Deltaproteobacteria bacterium]